MNAEAIRKMLNVQPFEPLEAELSSGQVFTIKHPENVIVMKNTLVVADPESETVQWTSLIHVVAVCGANRPCRLLRVMLMDKENDVTKTHHRLAADELDSGLATFSLKPLTVD